MFIFIKERNAVYQGKQFASQLGRIFTWIIDMEKMAFAQLRPFKVFIVEHQRIVCLRRARSKKA